MNADAHQSMPPADPSGRIRTLNKMGYMTSTLDPYSAEFARFAPSGPGPALDIGAAYGIATIAALSHGALVIANDIDPRHLEILRERLPKEARPRLSLKPGAFPDELHLPEGSVGSILISRVLHFFDGPCIEHSAQRAFRWLAPGGKIFIVAETPYLGTFREFIPIYEERKKAGIPWPGLVDNISRFIPPDHAKALPKMMNLLDEDVLVRVFKKTGFAIERSGTMARPDFPTNVQFDGRESVGLIARKELNGR